MMLSMSCSPQSDPEVEDGGRSAMPSCTAQELTAATTPWDEWMLHRMVKERGLDMHLLKGKFSHLTLIMVVL